MLNLALLSADLFYFFQVRIYAQGRSVAITGDEVTEGQTVSIDGSEAILEVPEGCIYCLRVVPFYDDNMPPLQRERLCCSLLELLWDCILSGNACPMTDK
jgi:hypothetical protein